MTPPRLGPLPPDFGSKLSPDQIAQVKDYIRELEKKC